MVSNWHALTMPECRLRVDGTAGSLLSVKDSATADQALLTVRSSTSSARQLECSRQRAALMGMGESMKCLLSAIDVGSAPHHSGRDNLETMAIVDAAYLSASRGGSRVEIAEVWQ